MSKFALVGFSQTLRAELLKDGIYVTTVCPHLMRTGSYRNVAVRGGHHREAAWFAPNLFAVLTGLAASLLLPSPSAAPDAGQLRHSLRLDLGWMERWLPRAAAIDLNQPAPVAQ